MRAIVHAQQTGADGRCRVYRVPFRTVGDARRYVRGVHSPERAVLVAPRLVEAYDGRTLVSRERV
jgi:hypothetical protein